MEFFLIDLSHKESPEIGRRLVTPCVFALVETDIPLIMSFINYGKLANSIRELDIAFAGITVPLPEAHREMGLDVRKKAVMDERALVDLLRVRNPETAANNSIGTVLGGDLGVAPSIDDTSLPISMFLSTAWYVSFISGFFRFEIKRYIRSTEDADIRRGQRSIVRYDSTWYPSAILPDLVEVLRNR